MKTKTLNLFLVAGIFGLLLVTSCKNEKKEERKEEARELADDTELAELLSLYPVETMAIEVISDSTDAASAPVVTTTAKDKSTKSYKVASGQAFTNKNGDVVGAVYTTVSEQDTVRIHVLETDTLVSPEKVSQRRFKGVAVVNNKNYTFDQPVQVTKDEKNGVAIDGTLKLTPDGDATATETETTSDPVQVKIKVKHDGETVKKYKDLVTGAQDKQIYDAQGNLLKDRVRGGGN